MTYVCSVVRKKNQSFVNKQWSGELRAFYLMASLKSPLGSICRDQVIVADLKSSSVPLKLKQINTTADYSSQNQNLAGHMEKEAIAERICVPHGWNWAKFSSYRCFNIKIDHFASTLTQVLGICWFFKKTFEQLLKYWQEKHRTWQTPRSHRFNARHQQKGVQKVHIWKFGELPSESLWACSFMWAILAHVSLLSRSWGFCVKTNLFNYLRQASRWDKDLPFARQMIGTRPFIWTHLTS